MFGYVRPCAEEMKIREFERFRAAYCGLCHELGREYGLAGRAILNYDFVFLAMLLWGDEENCAYCFRRCLPGFCRKRCVCRSAKPLTDAAGHSVILAYWKAQDGVNDEKGVKKLWCRCQRAFLRRAYKRAAAKYPEFDAEVRLRLSELSALEGERSESLDRTADKFALLLSSASKAGAERDARALEQLLYHVGRIVYIADAYFDLADDRKAGRYNPIAARFGLDGGEVSESVRKDVTDTLMSSARLAAAAYELLPANYWTPVTKNIIYLGIPRMIRQVIDGTYATAVRGIPRRSARLPMRTESEL